MRPFALAPVLAGLMLLAPAPLVRAGEVAASAPTALSVTVYRNPYRGAGRIDLQRLGGFALVTETRTVHLPAGESRLRFEGLVDGIQPESAIVTGLPQGVVEKNRDAAVLSPEALIRAALDSDVTLVRTDPKTGKSTSVQATIRSANQEGVIFQTAEGVEAYKCSGLGESLRFDRLPTGLGATPTLSAITRTDRPVTAVVTLSYLATGFDWAASYVARVGADGRTLDLSGWITLANANGVSLPAASTQIVAGRLNREAPGADSTDGAPRVIAACWPQGTTSDIPPPTNITLVSPDGVPTEVIVTAERRRASLMRVPVSVMAMAAPAPPPPPPPPPEQLGDLKLYRVPETTTVAAHQMKQVRMVEQPGVPFTRVYSADMNAYGDRLIFPARVLLRAKNSLKDKLGLPLPSGAVAVFEPTGSRDLLVGEAPLRDTAVDEDVELWLGTSSDIQVHQTRLRYTAKAPEILTLSPELALAFQRGEAVEEVEISNARDTPAPFELRLQVPGSRIATADPAMELKDGRPIFRLTLPANGSVKVRYAVTR